MTTGVFDGDTAAVALPDDPVGWSLKVTRTAPVPGTLGQVCAALLCETEVPSGVQSLEWNAVFRMENRSNGGENTALTALANQYAEGPTWAMQVVAENRTASETNILYGIELDLCSAGLDPGNHRQGLAIYYGDAFPNTFNPTGAPTRQFAGITINPFMGMDRCTLGYGLEMGGHMTEAIGIASVGATAFSAYGSYDRAVLFTAGTTNSPWALKMGPGQTVAFSSGAGNGTTDAWFSGEFKPEIVGAVRIRVDATDLYLPVCSNHP